MEIFDLLIWLVVELMEWAMWASMAADTVAWSKSRKNRRERRAAKKRGERPPPRNAWTTVYLVLTPFVVALLILVVWKWSVAR